MQIQAVDDPDYLALQAIICAAGTDKIFCGRLLNGDRQHAITDFNLSDQAKKAILTIQADTLVAFAQALHCWMARQQLSAV
jgi:hypothetical protein